MQFPVSIELRRSFLLSISLALIHTLAAGSIVVLPWSWFVRSILLLVIGISAGYSLCRSEIVGLRLVGPARIDGLDSACHRFEIIPLADTTVFNHLIVLRFKTIEAKRVKSLTLFPDQMTAREFRVLRLWLRWRAVSQIGGEAL